MLGFTVELHSTRNSCCDVTERTKHRRRPGHAVIEKFPEHVSGQIPGHPQCEGLPDTSAPRHFGTKTVRHQYKMVPKCLETIRHQIFTGAELSKHFGTNAEIPRDTSAPSVKNTYGLLFRQNRPTISTICRDLPILQLVQL